MKLIIYHILLSCCFAWTVTSSSVSPIESIPPKISPPAYSTVNTSYVSSPLTSPPASSYPAVLGRLNGENKPKVPPPVPPRGTPKFKRGGASGKGVNRNVFGNLHDGLAVHAETDFVDKVKRSGRIFRRRPKGFCDSSDVCIDPREDKVTLMYFGTISSENIKSDFEREKLMRSRVSENLASKCRDDEQLYFTANSKRDLTETPDIYVTDEFCHIDCHFENFV